MADEPTDEFADIRAEMAAAYDKATAAEAAKGKDAAAEGVVADGKDKDAKPAKDAAKVDDKKPDAKADAAAEGDEEAAEEATEAEPDKTVAKDDKAAKPADDKAAKSKRLLMREQIKRLEGTTREANAEIARLAAELAAAKAAPVAEAPELDADGKPKPKVKTEAQIREEVRAEEAQKREKIDRQAAEKEFNDACNVTFDKGAETFGKDEFEESTDTLQLLGMNARHVEAALATDAPERVLFLLGQDPEEAKRVFALPPLKMAAAMAKIASSRPRTAAKVSAAPAPIRTVDGKGAEADEVFDDKASDAVVDKVINGAMERIQGKWN
jgi:hypothetical protein